MKVLAALAKPLNDEPDQSDQNDKPKASESADTAKKSPKNAPARSENHPRNEALGSEKTPPRKPRATTCKATRRNPKQRRWMNDPIGPSLTPKSTVLGAMALLCTAITVFDSPTMTGEDMGPPVVAKVNPDHVSRIELSTAHKKPSWNVIHSPIDGPSWHPSSKRLMRLVFLSYSLLSDPKSLLM